MTRCPQNNRIKMLSNHLLLKLAYDMVQIRQHYTVSYL
jgi:hypothetical protein